MAKSRFTREDWLDFGLQQLATGGPDALKVKALCTVAGRTIGSFYHHFQDQAAFFDALLGHWRKVNTDSVLDALQTLTPAQQETQKLSVLAQKMDQGVELGMRRFAASHELAAKAVYGVDQLRIEFLAKTYQTVQRLDPDAARRLAELEYAAFVGVQTIWRPGTLAHGQALSSLFQSMVRSHYPALDGRDTLNE